MIIPTPNPGQEYIIQEAINWFYNSNEQIFQYDGPPGSGKSFVLMEIVRRLGLDIFREVAPMSFIGAASLVMRTKGLITARTAHSWIYEVYEVPKKNPDTGEIMYKANGMPYKTFKFKPKDSLGDSIKLIIIDEGYCMPLSMKSTILKFGLKILVCGDQNQLPPVKDKPAFLVEGKIYHLTQVMRQIGIEDIIFIADRAMRGLPLLNGYYGNSMVIDREDLTDSMLLWADVIITCRNATRDKINAHIRYIKGYKGLLPNYGERIVCRNNNWDIEVSDQYGNTINLVNGLIGTVINQPSVDTFSQKDRTFNIQFAPDLATCVFNCSANYDHMISDNETRNMIRSSIDEVGQMFEFAYAITCHISQGSQFHKVIYIEENMGGNIQSCLNLVGPTRADQQLIYVKNNYKPWIDYDDPVQDNTARLERYNNRMKKLKSTYDSKSPLNNMGKKKR